MITITQNCRNRFTVVSSKIQLEDFDQLVKLYRSTPNYYYDSKTKTWSFNMENLETYQH